MRVRVPPPVPPRFQAPRNPTPVAGAHRTGKPLRLVDRRRRHDDRPLWHDDRRPRRGAVAARPARHAGASGERIPRLQLMTTLAGYDAAVATPPALWRVRLFVNGCIVNILREMLGDFSPAVPGGVGGAPEFPALLRVAGSSRHSGQVSRAVERSRAFGGWGGIRTHGTR